jgi:hypothetical protein
MRLAAYLVVFCTLPLAAQNAALPPAPTNSDPLTPGEKSELALKNVFGLGSLAGSVSSTGLRHLANSPEEWGQGPGGFARRFGSFYGRLAIRESITLGSDLAFKTEPRYDRCECSGIRNRTFHALRRVIIARRDNGKEMLNISSIAGAFGGAFIADQWYPDRYNTVSHHFTSTITDLAILGGIQVVWEFLPISKRQKRISNRY